jgi:hypothetical protein
MVVLEDVRVVLLAAALGLKVTLVVLVTLVLIKDLVEIQEHNILYVMTTIVGINNLFHILVDWLI